MLVVDDDCVCLEASLGACRLLGVARAPRSSGARSRTLLEPGSRERFDHVWHAFRTAAATPGRSRSRRRASVVEVGATVTADVLPRAT